VDIVEASHSGLVRLLGKQIYSKGYRRFESSRLRLRSAEALVKASFTKFRCSYGVMKSANQILMSKKYKLGVFLEAGGNMVFFSNGVLKKLKEENIKIDYLVGYSSSSAIILGYLFDCFDYSLEVFGDQLNNNKNNFYLFQRNHFPHNHIYKNSVEKLLNNFSKNGRNCETEFTIFASKTANKFVTIKVLLASVVLLLNKMGLNFKKVFNKIFKIQLFEVNSRIINDLEGLLNIIMGSSCIYPFIKPHFYEGNLILEGELVKSGYQKYFENCERGIFVHTDIGKTHIMDNVLHIYSGKAIPFNILDYTDGHKLEVMQKAGEDEVWSNLDLIKKFVA
jgi:hypothetical protein